MSNSNPPIRDYAVKVVLRTVPVGPPLAKDGDFREGIQLLEERVLFVRARDGQQAVQLAEELVSASSHVNPYGQTVETESTGICDAYELSCRLALEVGVELFSATRVLPLSMTDDQLADVFLGPEEEEDGQRRVFLNSEFSGSIV